MIPLLDEAPYFAEPLSLPKFGPKFEQCGLARVSLKGLFQPCECFRKPPVPAQALDCPHIILECLFALPSRLCRENLVLEIEENLLSGPALQTAFQQCQRRSELAAGGERASIIAQPLKGFPPSSSLQ